MRIARAVVLIVVTATGCGGGDQASKPTAPPAPPGPVSSSSRLGCDVPSACSTVEAEETLKRCPASRLDARGRKLRERLVRLLARIERVDLHNRQVDEAYAAAMKALTDLERACL
ncbi:MAG: hypothetical protein ACJ75P_05735 [Gaiellaceae bacterium]